MKKYFLIFLLTSILGIKNIKAEDISLSASVDRNTVSVGEQFSLQVAVSGNVSNIPNPQLPSLNAFAVYSSGRSQNVSIVNGQVYSSVTFNYILVPNNSGKYTIDPITLSLGGQVYKTEPINIEVTKAGAPAVPQPGNVRQESAPASRESKDLFVTASVDKARAYVNEQITYTFRFYHRVNLLSQPQYQPADTTGFWNEDLPPQRNYYADIEGSRYLVTEVKTALFPTSAGKFTIGAARLQCSVEDFSPDNAFNDDFFRSFFSQGKTRVLQTSPISITVLPLPVQGKPGDFNGAVGQYNISARVDRDKVKTNEAVTLTVEIKGKGNVKTIPEPGWPAFDNFRKYETLSSFSVSKENYVVRGAKSFNTVLSPQVSGQLSIPSIRFSYFDPEAGTYRTASSRLINLPVTPGTVSAAQPLLLTTPQGVKMLAQDIRHIKTIKKIKSGSTLLYQSRIYLTFHLLPLLFLAGWWGFNFYQEKIDRDPVGLRRKKAWRNSRKHLVKAKELLSESTVKEFAAEIALALNEYLADKLNCSSAGLTFEQLKNKCLDLKIENNFLEKIRKVQEEGDFARFAPGNFKLAEMEKLWQETENLLKELERVL